MASATEQTSRWANDPRVTGYYPEGDDREGYTVTTDEGRELYVLHTDVFAWTVCEGPNLDFVPAKGGPSGFAIGIATADGAIEAILGEPQEA